MNQFPMYHWSPTTRRKQIIRRGLVPGSLSTDRIWRPPYVCFADDPQLGWILSGGTDRGRGIDSWDLWMMWSGVPNGYEGITDTYRDSGKAYFKEYRVYERVFKRDLWLVATREGAV